VGFYWTCQVLAEREVRDAIEALAQYAVGEIRPGIHGPRGMGLAYPAARAIARLAGDISHDEVRRLLASSNIWLRAGALAGLTEARAPGLEGLLGKLLDEHQPGLIRNHAQVGLALLGASARTDHQVVTNPAPQ